MSHPDLQGMWTVVRYREDDGMVEPLPDGREPAHLHIEGDQVAGTMGVNRIIGRFGADGLPGPLATTMMAGPPELMKQETALLRLLQDADSIQVAEEGMTWSQDGLNLVELQRSGTNETDRSSE